MPVVDVAVGHAHVAEIDAECRECGRIVVEREVGCREPELATPAIAMDHDATKQRRRTEQDGRLLDVATANRRADSG